MEYLNTYKVNTIYWVPSALNIVANWDTFSYIKPEYLKKVLFAGEVMPVKQLNYWRQALPDIFTQIFSVRQRQPIFAVTMLLITLFPMRKHFLSALPVTIVT